MNAFRHFSPAHPACNDGLIAQVGIGHQVLSRAGGVGHGLRRQHHQQAVSIGVAGRDFQRFGVDFRRGIAQQVDGVGVAPCFRQQIVERGHRVVGNIGQCATITDERVCGEDAGATRVRQDHQALVFGARLLADDLCRVENIRDGIYTQHPHPAEGRVQYLVAARKRPGMRGGSLRGGFGAPGLNNDNRLFERNLTRSRQERARIAHRFHVNDDGLGVRVIAQVVDHVAPVHIQHGADRHKRAKPDVLLKAVVQHGGTHGPALAQKANVTLQRHRPSKGGIHPADGVHHAQAVRPHNAHPPPRNVHDLGFHCLTFGAALLKARRDDNGPLRTVIDRLLHQARDGLRRRYDNDHIHRAGAIADALVSLYPQYKLAARVHRVYHAPKGAGNQVIQNGSSDGVGALGCAHHGHAFRLEQRVHADACVVVQHACCV